MWVFLRVLVQIWVDKTVGALNLGSYSHKHMDRQCVRFRYKYAAQKLRVCPIDSWPIYLNYPIEKNSRCICFLEIGHIPHTYAQKIQHVREYALTCPNEMRDMFGDFLCVLPLLLASLSAGGLVFNLAWVMCAFMCVCVCGFYAASLYMRDLSHETRESRADSRFRVCLHLFYCNKKKPLAPHRTEVTDGGQWDGAEANDLWGFYSATGLLYWWWMRCCIIVNHSSRLERRVVWLMRDSHRSLWVRAQKEPVSNIYI